MIYISTYDSIIGKLFIACRDNKLIGLWIENQKYFLNDIKKSKEEIKEKDDEQMLIKTKKWLDRYFKGENPEISELELNPAGSIFKKEVLKILCTIPYGKTMTYSEIAEKIAKKEKREKMSSQAVGGAVGHNPISIIIPCHRVVGKDGNLTGYAGGIDTKIKLLEHEKVDMSKFFCKK